MADWSLPTVSSLYTEVINELKNRDIDLAKLFDGTTSTNIEVGTIRWNSTNNRFEKYNGTSWDPLTSQYSIDVATLGGNPPSYYTDASNITAGVLPAGRIDDTSHGALSGGNLHAVVTTSSNGFMSASDKTKLDGIEAGATTDQTDIEILNLLKNVDGSGSGLDADLLDGLDSILFNRRVAYTSDSGGTSPQWERIATITISNVGDDGSVKLALVEQGTDAASYFSTVELKVAQAAAFGSDPYVYTEHYYLDNIQHSFGYIITSNAGPTTIDLYIKLSATNLQIITYELENAFNGASIAYYTQDGLAISEPANIIYATQNKLWHSGNDGSGSGLDADTLDGLHASDLASNGEFRSIQVFTVTGTWTKPEGLKRVKVTVVGGGGGGASAEANKIGASGGGGGTAIKVIDADSLGATETVTVGGGGFGAPPGGSDGNNGGTSSFGAHCSVTGGGGGRYWPNGGVGGGGGSAAGGDINITGGHGSPSTGEGTQSTQSFGGGSYLGFGGHQGALVDSAYKHGTGYGGGGAGVRYLSTIAGGDGSQGIIIVEEYF